MRAERILVWLAAFAGAASAAELPRAKGGQIFANGWEGCSAVAWTNTGSGGGVVGSPVIGGPSDPTPVRRYSGNCAMLATSGPSFVRDVSPGAEPKYRARVHVYTGQSNGEVVFLRAADAANNSKLRVSYDTTVSGFRVYVGADNTSDAIITGVVANRWYSISFIFSNASPAEVRITVRGAGSANPLANDIAAGSSPAGTDVIDSIEVGWVSTLTAATGSLVVDNFFSTRTGQIPDVCRGDADGDARLDVLDSVKILREFASSALAPGMPDCNENGNVDAIDRVCVRSRIIADATCP